MQVKGKQQSLLGVSFEIIPFLLEKTIELYPKSLHSLEKSIIFAAVNN
jgi:hypothetical protein